MSPVPDTISLQPEPKWDRHPIPTTVGTTSRATRSSCSVAWAPPVRRRAGHPDLHHGPLGCRERRAFQSPSGLESAVGLAREGKAPPRGPGRPAPAARGGRRSDPPPGQAPPRRSPAPRARVPARLPRGAAGRPVRAPRGLGKHRTELAQLSRQPRMGLLERSQRPAGQLGPLRGKQLGQHRHPVSP